MEATMSLNDLPEKKHGTYSDAVERRHPSHSSYSTRSRLPSEQSRRRRRDALSTKVSLFKKQSIFKRIDTRTRTFIVLGLALILALLLIFIISSCVHSCTQNSKSEVEVNSIDSRVAAGTSEELTKQLASKLDQNKNLTWIAEHANEYPDESVVELALNHPDAIDFVANYPGSDKKSSPYGESVTQGKTPQLYTWDSRWGGVSYAGSILATKGSGPTALSMAYMGLTGKTNWSPADIAGAVEAAQASDTDSGMNKTFLEKNLNDLGLIAESYTISAANIRALIDAETYLLVEVKPNILSSDAAHWVLITGENDDGTVNVYDPMSSEVSSRPWAPSTIANAASALYTVSTKSSE